MFCSTYTFVFRVCFWLLAFGFWQLDGLGGPPFLLKLPEASCQWPVASLSHNHLLDFHVVAVDQAQHVDTGGLVEADGGVAVDGLAADDAAGDVDHL